MMKRRVQKPSWLKKYKKFFYIGGGALTLGITSFVITVIALNNNYSEIEEEPISQIEYSYKTDESSIRINPESLKKSELDIDKKVEKKEETQKTIIQNDKPKTDIAKNKVEEEKTIEVSSKSVKQKITFNMPIDGEIILEYAKDKLVYSQTLEEWITHSGVDIKGEEAMPVKVSADGIIKDKKFDPRYGNTIIVEHADGYKTIYSNLSTLDLVEVNQEVKQGDIISGVGEGYGFECEEGAHVHWEIFKNNASINPMEFSD